MAIEALAAMAAKKAVVDVAPVVVTAVATAITKEIINHSDDIIEEMACAPFKVAGEILDSIDRWFF
ncbi:hypothetical protein Fisuc_0087 [Fibrobacter succinogenes subsp. succinogenes S85]|uniref:Lipoprotein n=1 Tax=Fibrobacter succinogenes (strain ATCC 19169 / S85) TaxID=59374 RepID=A0ABN3YSH2_FIBSS|nr:hypothetical protein [Fibrobacter succinogenes]ACX73702.1 hypothetical protein Fisuc_0087 [Fibrobacter succinogenes subsp. succinogenes S85]